MALGLASAIPPAARRLRARRDRARSSPTMPPAIHVGLEEPEILVLPARLDGEPWRSWIAGRIVGDDRVSVAGALAGADAAAWEWLLASPERHAEEPGLSGSVTPRWHDGTPPAPTGPRALVIPHVPAAGCSAAARPRCAIHRRLPQARGS